MIQEVSSDPAEVIVDRQERVLIITWKDGHRSVYSFDDLRRDCPCASCDDARSKR
ncbi:MAG TPA: gamma-butyrobetaine hydroxylase-like domain-containing protein, partial [Candidatus Methylomirabilis sp.]|nr:gamma-butyrobetaine hydroxylase-like domain-containing protein [Candidatus Methylomirabilis sp.]